MWRCFTHKTRADFNVFLEVNGYMNYGVSSSNCYVGIGHVVSTYLIPDALYVTNSGIESETKTLLLSLKCSVA